MGVKKEQRRERIQKTKRGKKWKEHAVLEAGAAALRYKDPYLSFNESTDEAANRENSNCLPPKAFPTSCSPSDVC